MTAEIAILNKGAVALAADSAVTIQIGSGQKIYNTVNKLFTLSKYQPVGAMVYGNSEFMGVPWESIIKEHRRELGKTVYGTLREYVDGFIAWMATAKFLFSDALQKQTINAIIRTYFGEIKNLVEQKIASRINAGESVDPGRVLETVTEIISGQRKHWLECAQLSTIAQDFEQKFIETHGAEIEEARKSIFQSLPFRPEDAVLLPHLVAAIFNRDRFTDGASGLVIAGFGRDEVFPVLIHCLLETITDGVLKWKQVETATVDQLKNNATIIPFAQREMVDTFLSGVDPTFKNTVLQSLEQVLRTSTNEIFQAIPSEALPNKSELVKKLSDKIPELIGVFNDKLDGYSRRRHIAPIMNAVAALPKDELAAMAESLVNLTSFKRRISTDAETVGGEIDVAVISKGDGFVWIKRKHYFDAGRNPHFMAKYYLESTP